MGPRHRPVSKQKIRQFELRDSRGTRHLSPNPEGSSPLRDRLRETCLTQILKQTDAASVEILSLQTFWDHWFQAP